MPTPPFTLVFTGSLTVSQSEAVQASLLEALTEHASVEIDCSDVEDIDISFLQILSLNARGNEPDAKWGAQLKKTL